MGRQKRHERRAAELAQRRTELERQRDKHLARLKTDYVQGHVHLRYRIQTKLRIVNALLAVA